MYRCNPNNSQKDKGKMPCRPLDKRRDGCILVVHVLGSGRHRGRIKINVDGSFVEQTSVTVVARNSEGVVVLTAWRALFRCADAAEAEACVEGVRLATQLAQGSVIIESDCI